MLLAIDIENSCIEVGCFEGTGLLHRFSLCTVPARTADEYVLLLEQQLGRFGIHPTAITGMILGSVVPLLTPILQAAARALSDAPLLSVGPGLRTGFAIRVDDPAELGADLAADAAGAIALCGAPVLALHFGTVTAISLIDPSGAYIGGAFLPGLAESASALQAAQLLPGVCISDRVPLVGKNSAECMRVGLLRGQGMAVCGMLEAYRREPGFGGAPVVATGEFAPLLLPYLGEDVRHVPELTLTGLAHIFELNSRRH